MLLTFSPIRHEPPLQVSVAGDVLTLNGLTLDLSALPEGATLPQAAVDCAWLASDIHRIGGELQLTLLLPHGANAPEQTLFPEPIVIAEGPVDLPPFTQDVPPPPLDEESDT
jgi:hypothetical protein